MKKYIHIIGFVILSSSCEDLFELETSDDVRDKIIRTWECIEYSQVFYKSTTGSYTVDISKDPYDSTYVVLDNFYGLGIGYDLRAKLDGKNLTINNETIDDHIVNGTGVITNNYKQIDWEYNVELPDGEIDNVTAVYTPYE